MNPKTEPKKLKELGKSAFVFYISKTKLKL